MPQAARSEIALLNQHYNSAESEARKLTNEELHKLVFTLQPDDSDRKLLENGGATENGDELCIFCNHKDTMDYPNTNVENLSYNIRMKSMYESKCANDERIRSRGGVPRKDGSDELKRKRREPQYKPADIVVCQCRQFGCTTSHGEVSKAECSIQCIDPKTGK